MKLIDKQSLTQILPQRQPQIGSKNECGVKDTTSKAIMTSTSVRILSMLIELYGKNWELTHGKSDSDALINFMNSVDQYSAKRIFSHCQEQVQNGNKWAPNLIQLITYRDSPTEHEFTSILTRVKVNHPRDRIEKYLCEHIRFNLRRAPEDKEMALLKSKYREAYALDKNGELRTGEEELKALPINSVKNTNDLAREAYEAKHGKGLLPRIQRLKELAEKIEK